MPDIRERDIERYLVKRVGQLGGHAYKFTSMGRRGVPDRNVHLPLGVHFYVECKAPGEQLTPAQMRERELLQHFGARVYWVDSYEGIDEVLSDEWQEVEARRRSLAERDERQR